MSDNRASIKKTMVRRLTSGDGPGTVLALSGSWGCGKTHLWNEVQRELVNKGYRVASVSAFGPRDINELKAAILNEAIVSADGTSLLWKSIGRVSRHAPTILRVADQKLGIDILSRAVDLTRFVAPGTVVCIDDVERATDTLPLDQILGLANVLCEQRSARVLLILNDSHIADQDDQRSKILREYRERVVRLDLRLATEISDAATRMSLFPSSADAAIALDVLRRAGVTNLRTLILAGEFIRDAREEAKGLLTDDLVRQICVFLAERGAGTLRSAEFYDFSALVMSLDSVERRSADDPEYADRRRFIATYFADFSYQFSRPAYEMVAHGFLETSALRAPTEQSVKVPSEVLLEAWFGRRLIYFSDAENRRWLADCENVVNVEMDALTAERVFALLRASTVASEHLGEPISASLLAAIERAAVRAGQRGDRSFDTVRRGPFAPEVSPEIVAAYDRELTQRTTALLRADLLQAVRELDLARLSDLVMSNAVALTEFFNGPALVELHAARGIDRAYYFDALLVLVNTTRGLSDSANSLERLRTYVALAVCDPSMDSADLYRLRVVWSKLV